MDKLNNLRQKIRSLKRVTVSFSGGVDSTLVSKVAYDELGGQALAVTVKTEFITEDEILYAVNIAKDIGIKHKIVYVSLLDDEIIAKNPADRCYFCKLNILENLPGKIILDGTNADDDPGRPGMQALEELGINSPLKECGITKQEVREIAKKLGLNNHSKPANSCLATRIPFNENVTKEKLKQVEEAESELISLGIYGARARLNNEGFCLEIPEKYRNIYETKKDSVENKIKFPVNVKWT